MIKTKVFHFNPAALIEEVKKRPGLYSSEHPADRDEKLQLWKEVGAALCYGWDTFSRASAYDHVLTLQRKWRSLRDAYNRELRMRKAPVARHNRRVYMYFKPMSFLGGFEGELSEEDDQGINDVIIETVDPLGKPKVMKKTRKKRRKSSSSEPNDSTEPEPSSCSNTELTDQSESDRLFLLSFLPEMRQLPINIKMWARTQIANVMQEAVASHYGKHTPNAPGVSVKRQRHDSSE